MSNTDLARRLMATGHVEWMPGMRVLDRVPMPDGTIVGHYVVTAHKAIAMRSQGDRLPDLTDPATIGCLLAQLREAWDDMGLSVGASYDGGTGLWPWSVRGGKHHGAGFRVIGIHDTEAEAIIAAFEALP